MKKIKKFSSFLIAMLMLISFAVPAFAESESNRVTLKIANFNVAGLPDVNNWLGKNDNDISENQEIIGKYLTEGNFDIVAVQEDFTYHDYLTGAMSGYNYETAHSGSFLGGDGMNIFTRDLPIIDTRRDMWNQLSGVIEDGADELSSKGLMYSIIEIADGVYVDFYNIHADAYDSEKDRAAREDNFRQISDLIVENYEKNNRPVVIVGDFNYHFHGTTADDSNIHYYFLEKCGLKDAWVELYNGGDYYNFDTWKATDDPNHFDHYWGRWDSVEKIMYKSGGGIEITADSFRYQFLDGAGEGLRASDHACAEGTLTFTITDEFTGDTGSLDANGDEKNSMITELLGFLKILFKLFANFDQLLGLL